jgi:hypothetical protein
MVELIVNNELKKLVGTIVAYSEVLSRHLPGGSENINEATITLFSGLDLNAVPPESNTKSATHSTATNICIVYEAVFSVVQMISLTKTLN